MAASDRNWSDLITRVQDELDRTDIDSQIDRELRRAVEHYERQRWWFNETALTTTATSSTASLVVPDNLLLLDDVELVVSSRHSLLTQYSWDRFRETWREGTNTHGEPYVWAWRNSEVWWGPPPNQDYEIILWYVKTEFPQSFSDGTSNAWTQLAEDMITARALVTIGGRTLQLPSDTLRSWKAMEKDAYASLCLYSEQKLMTGSVKPWSG